MLWWPMANGLSGLGRARLVTVALGKVVNGQLVRLSGVGYGAVCSGVVRWPMA